MFVGSCLRVDTTQALSVWGFIPHMGTAGESPDIYVKLPLLAPLLIFPHGYLLNFFPQKIIVFHLLVELPKVIKPHLLVSQLYRWQLCPTMWSSRSTKSFNPIIVTAIGMDFQGESFGPTTGGFACNCPVPEAWITEAWQIHTYSTSALSC